MSLFDIWLYIKPWLDVFGYIATVLVIITTVLTIWALIRGLLPALIRLGFGFSRRKIAVFAKGDNFNSLKDLLLDSGLFNKSNVVQVSSKSDLGKAENVTLFLIHWPDWKKEINSVLKKKSDGTGVVVYSPISEGKIPNEEMISIGEHRNVAVTNFRGRLLNDIVITMITTSHKSR